MIRLAIRRRGVMLAPNRGETMTNPTTAGLPAALLLTLASTALADTSPGDLPAAVAPARIAGSGLNVIDLEAQRAG